MGRPRLGLRGLTGLLVALNAGALLVGVLVSVWPERQGAVLEFNGDKVKLLSLQIPESGSSPQPHVEPSAQEPARPDSQADTGCLAWQALDGDNLGKVEAALKNLGLGREAYQLTLEKPLGWWVYLPVFRSTEALRQAMDELRLKGVGDMAPVRSGSMANALSLGAFPSLDKARLQAERLTAKGVAGVRYGPRPGSGPIRLTLSGEPPADFSTSLETALPPSIRPGACSVP